MALVWQRAFYIESYIAIHQNLVADSLNAFELAVVPAYEEPWKMLINSLACQRTALVLYLTISRHLQRRIECPSISQVAWHRRCVAYMTMHTRILWGQLAPACKGGYISLTLYPDVRLSPYPEIWMACLQLSCDDMLTWRFDAA